MLAVSDEGMRLVREAVAAGCGKSVCTKVLKLLWHFGPAVSPLPVKAYFAVQVLAYVFVWIYLKKLSLLELLSSIS
jgi:hypothetical protein